MGKKIITGASAGGGQAIRANCSNYSIAKKFRRTISAIKVAFSASHPSVARYRLSPRAVLETDAAARRPLTLDHGLRI
jgi:hypothetical protein